MKLHAKFAGALIGLSLIIFSPTISLSQSTNPRDLPAETSPADGDIFPIWLESPVATRKVSIETLKGVFGQKTFVDVRMFGAVGDGVTDDTLAIQAAIDSLPDDGGIVFLPIIVNGDYKITSTVQIGDGSASAKSTKYGVHLIGETAGVRSPIYGGEKGVRLVWHGSAGGTMLSVNGPILNVRIESLALMCKGDVNAAGIGLYTFHLGQAIIRDLVVDDYTVAGIKVDAVGSAGLPSGVPLGGDDVLWEHVFVVGPQSTSAIALDFGATTAGGTATDNARHVFVGCEFRGGSAAAGRGMVIRFVDNIIFVQTHFEGGSSIEVISPTGDTTFPKAVTLLHGIISGNIVVTGTWAPPANHGLTFIPLVVESGTIPDDARIKGISGSTWFGSLIINAEGYDRDLQYSGDNDTNLLFGDASTDRVGIGRNDPQRKLDVKGAVIVDGNADEIQATIQGHSTQTSAILNVERSDGTDLLNVLQSGVIQIPNATGSSDGTGATPVIAWGTYAPTPVGVTNVAAADCPGLQWSRTGMVVTVSGHCNIDPTTGSTLTTVGIPLPVASNFTLNGDLAGSTTNNPGTAINIGRMRADTTNDRAQIDVFVDAGAASSQYFLHFTYQVK